MLAAFGVLCVAGVCKLLRTVVALTLSLFITVPCLLMLCMCVCARTCVRVRECTCVCVHLYLFCLCACLCFVSLKVRSAYLSSSAISVDSVLYNLILHLYSPVYCQPSGAGAGVGAGAGAGAPPGTVFDCVVLCCGCLFNAALFLTAPLCLRCTALCVLSPRSSMPCFCACVALCCLCGCQGALAVLT